jgi:hypothetical protein
MEVSVIPITDNDIKNKLENVEYFNYLDSQTTNDRRDTWDIKSRMP